MTLTSRTHCSHQASVCGCSQTGILFKSQRANSALCLIYLQVLMKANCRKRFSKSPTPVHPCVSVPAHQGTHVEVRFPLARVGPRDQIQPTGLGGKHLSAAESSNGPQPCVLETGSLGCQQLAKQAGLASLGFPGSTCVCLPVWDQRAGCSAWLVEHGSGIEPSHLHACGANL